jgi:hypothetical protein
MSSARKLRSSAAFSSSRTSPTVRKKTGMAPTAAYLIALALTLLILLLLWEGLS